MGSVLTDGKPGGQSSDHLSIVKRITGTWEPAGEQLGWLNVARAFAPFALILTLALWSRLRYAVSGYHYTYGSGDAHLILTRALLLRDGIASPPVGLGISVFADPPFLPLLLAAFSRVSGVPLATAPLIVGPTVTIAALLALYVMLRAAIGGPTALLSVCLISVLPRFSFDSTEPDKVAFVVSFSMLALFMLYEGQRWRPLTVAAGLFMGLAVFSHTTGYLFLMIFPAAHVAFTLAAHRRVVDRYALAAMLIPVAFIALSFQLERSFAPATGSSPGPSDAAVPVASAPLPSDAPLAPGTTSGGSTHHLVPRAITDRVRVLLTQAKDGFPDGGAHVFLRAISRNTSRPVFLLALAGFVTGAVTVLRARRWMMVPLLLWMAIVTSGIAIQPLAYSHATRYPSYVTPVFVILACFFVIQATSVVVGAVPTGARSAIYVLLVGPFALFAGWTYVTASNPGLRQIYAPHRYLVNYLVERGTLGQGAHLLYQGWPSVTFYLLDKQPGREGQLQTYGWGTGPPLETLPAYIRANGIQYFVYDHVGSDYLASSDAYRGRLARDFALHPAAAFCEYGEVPVQDDLSTCVNYIVLYELRAGLGVEHAQTPAEVHDNQRRLDLASIAHALQQYRELHGSYPTTPAAQTLCLVRTIDAGCALNEVLAAIPRDPGDRTYWYKSDGDRFTLWASLEAAPADACNDRPQLLLSVANLYCISGDAAGPP